MRTFRGIVNALMICIPLWLLVTALILWVTR